MNSLILDLIASIEAELEEREARERYIEDGGCDWDYHGHYAAEVTRKAHERFEATLNEVIDARVRKALEQRVEGKE